MKNESIVFAIELPQYRVFAHQPGYPEKAECVGLFVGRAGAKSSVLTMQRIGLDGWVEKAGRFFFEKETGFFNNEEFDF